MIQSCRGFHVVDIWTYSTAGGLVVAALASDLEGYIVGSVALDLDGTGREVVEVLVQQLYGEKIYR